MILFLWRMILLIVNVVCVIVLLYRFRVHHKLWAETTRDYWWTLLLWSVAAIEIAIQGLVQHRPLSVALVFVSIASLATPMGLRRKSLEHKDDPKVV